MDIEQMRKEMDKALTRMTGFVMAFCMGLLFFYMLHDGTIPQWANNAYLFSAIGFLACRITGLQNQLEAQRQWLK